MGKYLPDEHKKVQVKQNTVIRIIFFAITHGQNTESSFPLVTLLDILNIESLYKLNFLGLFICDKEINFRIFFMTIFSLLVMFIHIAQGMPPKRIFINLKELSQKSRNKSFDCIMCVLYFVLLQIILLFYHSWS